LASNSDVTLPLRLGLGLRAGATAGLALLVAECVASVGLGGSPVAPLRLAASAVLGAGALSPLFPLPGPVVLGGCIFLIAGSLLGGLFALILGRCRPQTSSILALGAAYGGGVWIVIGVTVGPVFLPQVAVLDLLWQGLVAYVLCFGFVLGALLAADWPR
jgi:hypothetical protein